jgi:hypothetical protein
MNRSRMTLISSLCFEDESHSRVRRGLVTFADGLVFRFSFDPLGSFVSLAAR